MKYIYILLLLFLVSISCKNETLLTFETLFIEDKTCENCPVVTIDIPKALEKNTISKNINTALQEEIIALLNFDEATNVNSIKTAIASFNEGYTKLKDKFPEESTKWEAVINGEVVYENKYILTIALDSYIFTGGAHGYSVKRFLNFNKKNGAELENWELFNTNFDFEKFAEIKFRIQEDIPQDTPINYTGFMFEEDSFYLPENIGFTKEGIQLLYNQYEVASYADGPITITIPYNEANKYLVTGIKN
ncbi:DUF3298 and DUF4163 domain-containing protein [uncultured Maribacter sp.]|uniref:DUF3298 and DUF4163 domain-containing protein n=1 Tax=uncultured Maribacter sp. TaxID=431308 RepID=UPI0026357D2B|nr:DUF3298 and DUF4163 domain-containing protein [uncultured Maribacter sp.]